MAQYKDRSRNFIRLEGGGWGGLLDRPVAVGQSVELVRRDGEVVSCRVLEVLPSRFGLHCFAVASRDLAKAIDLIEVQAERIDRLAHKVEVLTELLWSRS